MTMAAVQTRTPLIRTTWNLPLRMTVILMMTLVHQKMMKRTLRLPSQVPPKSTKGKERLLSLTPDLQERQNATTIHQNILAPPPPDQSNYRLQQEQFYIP
jgi:hypothetical protein